MVLIGCNLQQLITEADFVIPVKKCPQLVAYLGIVGSPLLIEDGQNLIKIVALHSALQGPEDIAYDLIVEIQFLFGRRL